MKPEPLHESISWIPPGSCWVDDEQTLCRKLPTDEYLAAAPAPLIIPTLIHPFFGAPKLTPQKVDLPLPESDLGKIIYEIASQLESFELDLKFTLPVEGMAESKKTTDLIGHALLKDHSALIALSVDLNPLYENRFCDFVSRIPIIGLFFRAQVMRIYMDPETRRVTGKVGYIYIPFSMDVHQRMIDLAKERKLTSEDLKGAYYDLTKKIPLYSWQLADAFFKINQKGLAPSDQKGQLSLAKPVWEDSSLSIHGDFSNKTLTYKGLEFRFDALQAGQKHRFEVTGPITDPVLKIQGLAQATFEGETGSFYLSSAENIHPLEIKTHWDPTGTKPVSIEIPSYQSQSLSIEAMLSGDKKIQFKMEKGIVMEGLKLTFEENNPSLSIDRLTGRKIGFEGLGVVLNSNPDALTTLENIRFVATEQKPLFDADIRGSANGSVRYFMNDEEMGYLEYELLKANGHVSIAPDKAGEMLVTIEGQLETTLPRVDLMVTFPRLDARVRTSIGQAQVRGEGILSIRPSDSAIEITSTGSGIVVTGKGGVVDASFNLSPYWPDAHITLDLKQIDFAFDRLKMTSSKLENGKKAAFEIKEAFMGPIHLEGQITGAPFIDSRQKRKKSQVPWNAKVTLQGLSDTRTTNENPARTITFSDVSLNFTEQESTLGVRDQARCGPGPQHIVANVEQLKFDPILRQMDYFGVKTLSILLAHPSGCLVVKE